MDTNKDLNSPESLSDDKIRKLASEYLKAALPLHLFFIIAGLAGFMFIFISHTPLIQTIVGITGGVAFIFAVPSAITSLVAASRIKKRNFMWTTGTITRYTIHWVSRTTYIYAVIDEQHFCNIWSNPVYSKNTEVYLLSTGKNGPVSQSVLVRCDKVES
ncbi:MAG: hypothetical protein ILA15_08290 [Clostridiales bacterium]|nr:hypothetical protein [Clostridiales bacterium]